MGDRGGVEVDLDYLTKTVYIVWEYGWDIGAECGEVEDVYREWEDK